jgi:predicted nucleic acid-binding protein
LIFLDSSAIIAYKNADDINHKKAANIFQKLNAGNMGSV